MQPGEGGNFTNFTSALMKFGMVWPAITLSKSRTVRKWLPLKVHEFLYRWKLNIWDFVLIKIQ